MFLASLVVAVERGFKHALEMGDFPKQGIIAGFFGAGGNRPYRLCPDQKRIALHSKGGELSAGQLDDLGERVIALEDFGGVSVEWPHSGLIDASTHFPLFWMIDAFSSQEPGCAICMLK